ncbi:2-dehydropantoate 2-reductase [Rhizobium sp. BK376]|uniref:2-dehydropantoate 2-reductase n=1 Tax=Rhizobium sp. BK376 TaxID=2512149 RepID=UPI00104B196C|nr:2-dehydropantoate 2-reductase [Rhizobium sp. BK376]TCR92254.1 ketopantoate reductase [Rhizobium sp. BK376]
MRILVVGAGGIGGYFGGRLAAAGRDVTFLVRPKRAELLRESGLSIRSPKGDLHIAQPKLVTADSLTETFDLVLLGCKAYDLDDAMASFAPAVSPQTMILPTLNGMRHLERLEARFGAEAVLGGACFISSTIAPDGAILHFNDLHRIAFGDRRGGMPARIESIAETFSNAGFDIDASPNILQAMWDKWAFIASTAGMTCLMRAAIGDYVAAGASDLVLRLIDECLDIAAANGFAPGEAAVQRIRSFLTTAGSPITASMLRDIEGNGRIESDQIVGDMLARAAPDKRGSYTMLNIVLAHLRAYEAQRERQAAHG